MIAVAASSVMVMSNVDGLGGVDDGGGGWWCDGEVVVSDFFPAILNNKYLSTTP